MWVAALAGLGNATFHPVDFTILNQRVSAGRLGYAFSAHGLTGNLGCCHTVFFAGMGAAVGWRNAYVAAAVMYLVILAVLSVPRPVAHTGRTVCGAGARYASRAQSGLYEAASVWWCLGSCSPP